MLSSTVPQIRALSGSSTNNSTLQLGRTSADLSLAVAGSSLQYSLNAVQGDVVLRAENTSQKLILQTGASAAVLTINNGQVGIGTSTPAYLLDVAGQVQATHTGGGSSAAFISTSSGNQGYAWNSTSGATDQKWWDMIAINSGALLEARAVNDANNAANSWLEVFRGTGTAISSVDFPNGNVGIGTTSPSSTLQVNGTTSTTKFQMTNGATSGYILQSDASGNGSWVNDSVLTAANAWALKGNAGTVTGTNFIGTTDNVDLMIKVNGQQSGIIENNNNNQSTAFGYQALENETANSNTNNVAFGYQALLSNTGGYANSAFGFQALDSNTTGDYNSALGTDALANNSTGYSNVANGFAALGTNTTGFQNTANGAWTLVSNTTGQGNNAYGQGAEYKNTTGSFNTAMGRQSLFNNTTGSNNVALGFDAGYDETGNASVFLGYEAGYNETTGNKLYIANSNTTTPLIYGDFTNKHLTIHDSLTAKYLQLTNGANNGYILQGDAAGNATWANPATIVAANSVNIYVSDGTLTGNRTMTLAGKTLNFNGGNVGINNVTPGAPLDVKTSATAGTGALIAQFGSSVDPRLLFYDETSSSTLGGNLYFGSGSVAQVSSGGAFAIMPGVGNSNTYVGINTLVPGNTLTINGSGGMWNSNQFNFYTDGGATQRGFIGQNTGGGSSDLMLASTGSGNWMRIGANNSNIAFFPDGTIASTGGVPKVLIASNGYVGIGTAGVAPVVPLQVNLATASSPYSSTSVQVSHFGDNQSSLTQSNSALTAVNSIVAISAQGDVVAQGTITVASSVTYSDERIKDVIGQSDPIKDLETLNKIKVTDYTMKDKLWWGKTPFKKVIAQQVEQVYPLAVSRKVDFVPNIYAFATKVEKTQEGYLITVDKNIPELKTQKIRLEVKGMGRVEAGFVAMAGDNRLIVSTTADISKGEVFVYGAQVEDFRTVDYEAISMLNVSATQELATELKAAQERLKALEAENAKLKTGSAEQQEINKTQADIIKTMKAQIDAINERLNITTNK